MFLLKLGSYPFGIGFCDLLRMEDRGGSTYTKPSPE